MKYRNRFYLYFFVAIITAGLFILPPTKLTAAWAIGGLMYIASSIWFFVVGYLIMGKIVYSYRNPTSKENGSLILLTSTLAFVSIFGGLYTGDDFITRCGFALIYMAIEFKVIQNESPPRNIYRT